MAAVAWPIGSPCLDAGARRQPQCRNAGQVDRFPQAWARNPAAYGCLTAVTGWKRILAAAKRHDVEVSESSWRELAKGGKDRKG
jgi:hypothetical protein